MPQSPEPESNISEQTYIQADAVETKLSKPSGDDY